MASEIQLKFRAPGGAAGAPASLRSGEVAYNMQDGKFYIGYGDDGSGNATSVKTFGQDNFTTNVPSGGTNGKILGYSAGAPAWIDAPQGAVYTASGNGIELTGSEFALNYTEIQTGIGLSSYATTTALTTGLAGKANTTHTHDAADVVSGTLATARIPNLDAAKITSGTIDVARLPVLPGQNQVVATTNIASLTAPQQSSIDMGTIVTTSDGRRWVYNTGSKTLEASYVELADVTPEWTSIANKPSFATVATSGAYADLSGRPTLATVATSGAYADLTGKPTLSTVATTGAYSDLTGKPTLGTIASQAASNVAITGGTITGVTISGGTF